MRRRPAVGRVAIGPAVGAVAIALGLFSALPSAAGAQNTATQSVSTTTETTTTTATTTQISTTTSTETSTTTAEPSTTTTTVTHTTSVHATPTHSTRSGGNAWPWWAWVLITLAAVGLGGAIYAEGRRQGSARDDYAKEPEDWPPRGRRPPPPPSI